MFFLLSFFFLIVPVTTANYTYRHTLSLHAALPFYELSTLWSWPTCSAIRLPAFPPHPRTPSHGEGSARTWSTRPYRDTDASEWSRWDVHDQKGYPTVVTPQQARRSSVAGPCPSRPGKGP